MRQKAGKIKQCEKSHTIGKCLFELCRRFKSSKMFLIAPRLDKEDCSETVWTQKMKVDKKDTVVSFTWHAAFSLFQKPP